jgi:predicted MFS family arabinose efflux permease
MVGTLAYVFGWQASFFVLAVGALVFVGIAARLPDPVPTGGLHGGDPDRPELPDEPPTVPEAARVIATTRSLRLIYYSLPFLLGTVLGFTFYATAYYENVFHQDAGHRALLFGLAEPGAIIGLVIGTMVLPPRIAADPGKALRTIAWLAVAAAAGAACLALAPDVAVAYVAQLVFAGASAVVIAGVYALLSVALRRLPHRCPQRRPHPQFPHHQRLRLPRLVLGLRTAVRHRRVTASFGLPVRGRGHREAQGHRGRRCRGAPGAGRRDGPSPHGPVARRRL